MATAAAFRPSHWSHRLLRSAIGTGGNASLWSRASCSFSRERRRACCPARHLPTVALTPTPFCSAFQRRQREHRHQRRWLVHKSRYDGDGEGTGRWERYGSRTVIDITRVEPPNNHVLAPFVRTCLKRDPMDVAAAAAADSGRVGVKGRKMDDTGFAVSFLGTGGGAPSAHRIGSSTALRLGGMTFIFDACEGIQRQITFSRVLPTEVTKIFITHLHGDHLYGLPGLILTIQIAAKMSMQSGSERYRSPSRKGGDDALSSSAKRRVVEVYGPPGLHNYLTMALMLSCARIEHITLRVYELVGGTEERGPRWHTPGGNGGGEGQGRTTTGLRRNNVYLGKYPDFEYPRIQRRYIRKDADGTWTIQRPMEISRDMIRDAIDGKRKIHFSNEINSSSKRRFHIKAAEVRHLKGVQTFGYTVEEPTPPANIDAEKATAFGVSRGKRYQFLKNGFPVMSDDGTAEVRPEQVLKGERLRPRKFALLGDHREVTPAMAHLCADADVLVHEATMTSRNAQAADARGHCTAATAGRLAKEVNAKALILNHIGTTATHIDAIKQLVLDAKKWNDDVSQVIVAYDFMEVFVPRGGFKFEVKGSMSDGTDDDEQEEKSWFQKMRKFIKM